MFDVPTYGQLSREHWEKYAADQRDLVQKLKPVEADKVYQSIMMVSDMIGLDKYAKDGGMSYTMRELEIVRRIVSRKDLADANRVLHSAFFQAMDTDGDGLLHRDEWSNYLKIRNTYVSEEQAQESFDSVDTNKDGVISLPEFVEYSVDFWCKLGEDLGTKDLYGTKNL